MFISNQILIAYLGRIRENLRNLGYEEEEIRFLYSRSSLFYQPRDLTPRSKIYFGVGCVRLSNMLPSLEHHTPQTRRRLRWAAPQAKRRGIRA